MLQQMKTGAASLARSNTGPEPLSLYRVSSCCWKAHSLPGFLCAQATQRASVLEHCGTLALSLPVLVLSQHPQYDSHHSLGG